jgi:hypothetical protein
MKVKTFVGAPLAEPELGGDWGDDVCRAVAGEVALCDCGGDDDGEPDEQPPTSAAAHSAHTAAAHLVIRRLLMVPRSARTVPRARSAAFGHGKAWV